MEHFIGIDVSLAASAVRDLLMRVWEPARAKALEDAAVLERMLREDGIEGPLEPWDWRYCSERRRAAEHDLDEAALKPYLNLDRMIAASFACANRLFGLEFRELPGAPVYHPDVRAWEVIRDGRHMAWLEVPKVLAEFATHRETGEPMPEALRSKAMTAAKHDQAFQMVEAVASALVDLAFHEGEPPADPIRRQVEVLEEIGMPHAVAMRHGAPHFAHVFGDYDYAASYYSYLWSSVMDADAFHAFEEAGDPFDPETARRLEEAILSRGGAEEAQELYLAFRGRMPGPEAMLEGRGLAPA